MQLRLLDSGCWHKSFRAWPHCTKKVTEHYEVGDSHKFKLSLLYCSASVELLGFCSGNGLDLCYLLPHKSGSLAWSISSSSLALFRSSLQRAVISVSMLSLAASKDSDTVRFVCICAAFHACRGCAMPEGSEGTSPDPEVVRPCADALMALSSASSRLGAVVFEVARKSIH